MPIRVKIRMYKKTINFKVLAKKANLTTIPDILRQTIKTSLFTCSSYINEKLLPFQMSMSFFFFALIICPNICFDISAIL